MSGAGALSMCRLASSKRSVDRRGSLSSRLRTDSGPGPENDPSQIWFRISGGCPAPLMNLFALKSKLMLALDTGSWRTSGSITDARSDAGSFS